MLIFMKEITLPMHPHISKKIVLIKKNHYDRATHPGNEQKLANISILKSPEKKSRKSVFP